MDIKAAYVCGYRQNAKFANAYNPTNGNPRNLFHNGSYSMLRRPKFGRILQTNCTDYSFSSWYTKCFFTCWQTCLSFGKLCSPVYNTSYEMCIQFALFHCDWTQYIDVIMTTMASQITSLMVVYSDADQRKHQSSTSLAFVWGSHRDRWIPCTKGQLRGKCFHLMTSSCINRFYQYSLKPCFIDHLISTYHPAQCQVSQCHSFKCPEDSSLWH